MQFLFNLFENNITMFTSKRTSHNITHTHTHLKDKCPATYKIHTHRIYTHSGLNVLLINEHCKFYTYIQHAYKSHCTTFIMKCSTPISFLYIFVCVRCSYKHSLACATSFRFFLHSHTYSHIFVYLFLSKYICI